MRVLIVEDDINLLQTYERALCEQFTIDIASNCREATSKLLKNEYQVVLLDIMLPDGKGYHLIPKIKESSKAIVIMISALEEDMAKRFAYEQGADDYMIKPVGLFELEYKLKAIATRTNSEQLILQIGNVTLDLENLILSSAYNQLPIQHSQGVLLKLLYDKYLAGEILSKEELTNLEVVQKTDTFRIHTLISRLRKTIEELECDKVFIENVYGRGYRLVVMK